MFVGDWPAERERFTPDSPCLIDSPMGAAMSFRDFSRKVKRLSSFLFRNLKILKGKRIAIISENLPFHFELFFAAAKIGAVLVPLDASLDEETFPGLLADADPEVIFLSWNKRALVESFSALQALRHCFILSGEGEFDEPAIERSRVSDSPAEVELLLEDPLMLVYEKREDLGWIGSIVPQGMVAWNAINTIITCGLSPRDRTVLALPFGEKDGALLHALPLFLAGGATVLPGGQGTARPLESLCGLYGISLLAMRASQWSDPSRSAKLLAASPLRHLLSSDGPLDDKAFTSHLTHGLFVAPGFVSAQAGPGNFFVTASEHERHPGSVGRPLFHVEAIVGDEEAKALEAGEEGELFLRGHHLFSGYWNRATATRKAFVKWWLRTGIKAACRGGYFYLTLRPPIR
ncbi:MAG: AMP-binding protein [Candidatus Eremiobacteraeota bacterium]|nr:AMP-binding protein [Candidatus Eremiobacteraeota bacterium]